jgi:replicative DNA helicase
MISDRLASNFIVELIAYALNRRTTFDVVKAYLKFSYLQEEAEKKLWQWTVRFHDRCGRVPTIGQMQQQFLSSEKVLDLVEQIQDVEVDESSEGHDTILKTFEEYLRQMKFLEANDKIADMYNRGEKEKAYNMFSKFAEEMEKFSILDASFESVFEGFGERMIRRRSEDYNFRFRVPTGIDDLDYRLGGASGGPESGECVLWLGMSGAGKSQALVQLGINAARQGHRVAHFQLEGTKEQCLNRYDAAWTGTLYQDMKMGQVSAKTMEITQRVVKKLKRSDIYVSSSEEWGGKTIADIRRELKEIEKKHGKVDVIIIDYLELAETGDGILYGPKDERFRQQKLAKAMKTLAMEFNAVVHTATQSNDVNQEEKNDPAFVLSRNNLNEDKGKIRPFDIFVTLNQTDDERRDQTMRLHTDKLRDHKNGDPIHICTNFDYARFYDRKRTLSMDFETESED